MPGRNTYVPTSVECIRNFKHDTSDTTSLHTQRELWNSHTHVHSPIDIQEYSKLVDRVYVIVVVQDSLLFSYSYFSTMLRL